MASDKDKEFSSKVIDRRVIERYMKKGIVDEKDFARHLKALPDLTEKMSKVDTEFAQAGVGPTR